ncbi:MAG: neutral/alkaline non-lysosomal ceramidase N-terminal domain-containing protein [Lentisphaeria bacterium]|nr:neutral/alkaline non-lysosomal ceramidase N-terminal domain-containing protein [Lentisphaeria bacterium]
MKILTQSYVWLVASALFLTVGCAANVKCKDDCVQKITANNQVKIGWAKRSIDPGRVVPITGQLHLRISHGTHTPVLASALAMENNGDAVIFVSVDMVSVRPLIINTLRDILKAEAPEIPAEKVIVSATHTHSGPSHTDVSQESFPNQFKFMSGNDVGKFIVRQIADAVKEAWAKRAPGSIAYGYGLAVTGHSRRVAYLDDIGKRLAKTPGAAINGHVKKYGRTDDDMFAGYEAGFDAFINIVYTFDEKGKLNGAVVNVPCPAQTSENAWTLYASFWHNVREKLEAQYGEIGLICQSAGAGDLAPRQQHYKKAELRRYRLKYPKEMAAYMAKPFAYPPTWIPNEEIARKQYESDLVELMRAEDISRRIVGAFNEVLSWAKEEKFADPLIRHEVKTLQLSRMMFPEELVREEEANHKLFMQEKFITSGEPYAMMRHNSMLASKRSRCGGIVKRFAIQDKQPELPMELHVVKIGNIAFATNPFELFIDYMHRIQGRSPFEQTFIVQLTGDPHVASSYLATERAVANKGYSASPYSMQVSPKGGQELVDETVKILKELKK